MDKNSASQYKSVDEYIINFPVDVRPTLEVLRSTIKSCAPQAEEVISYGMPAFKLHNILVWFAAYKKHIGFYPGAAAIVAFEDQLINYKTSKGAIQFPIEKPLPFALIKKIVKYKLKLNIENAKAKKKKLR